MRKLAYQHNLTSDVNRAFRAMHDMVTPSSINASTIGASHAIWRNEANRNGHPNPHTGAGYLQLMESLTLTTADATRRRSIWFRVWIVKREDRKHES